MNLNCRSCRTSIPRKRRGNHNNNNNNDAFSICECIIILVFGKLVKVILCENKSPFDKFPLETAMFQIVLPDPVFNN